MARQVDLLKSIEVTRIRDAKAGSAAREVAEKIAATRGLKGAPGAPLRLADGQGLYLIVEPTGSARWLFLFRWRGKLKEMGLGGLAKVSLESARGKARDARELVGRDINPIDAKHAKNAVPTFGELADELITDLAVGFKNPKQRANLERFIGPPRPIKKRHGARWVEGLVLPAYAEALRGVRIDLLTATDVEKVIRPLWLTRLETAQSVRADIARVFRRAMAKDYINANPADWPGKLKDRLPPPVRKPIEERRRAALPYQAIPTFMRELRRREAMSALALEFAILTAARAQEVLESTWAEIDMDAALWTVPAERMKMRTEHRVPLCEAALALLRKVALLSARDGDPRSLIFPSPAGGAPLTSAAWMGLLGRMGCPVTQHGFRSSFRDWAGDATSFARDLAEHALAHQVGDAVELAYRRSNALERRRPMMEAWGRFCGGGAEIIELARAAQ